MAMSRTQSTYSGYYLHDKACDLAEEGHEIDKSFIEAMRDAADRAPVDVDVFATGCNTCMEVDAPAWIYWVAQGDASRTCHVKYGSEDDDFGDGQLRELIVEAAEDAGVAVSDPGMSSLTVVLGESRYYDNLDAGTRVAGRSDRTGVVVNEGFSDRESDYTVRVKHGYTDYEHLGKFDDRDMAEAFRDCVADDYDDKVEVNNRYTPSVSRGQNLVLWDGYDQFTVERTPDLEVLDA